MPSRARTPRSVLGRLQRREADVRRGRRLAGAATGAPSGGGPSPKRRSMRMIHPNPLFLVDLPVDVVVVLEQQE